MATDRGPGGSSAQAQLILPAGANDASFTPRARTVLPLVMNEGARRVQRQNEAGKPDELWIATAHAEGSDGPDIEVYLRLAHPQPLVAELVCAVVGRALGLPVPDPFIVRIDAGALPGSRFATGQTGPLYCFASRQVAAEPFVQLLQRDSAHAAALIERWEHLVPAATFDEWMANPDRNLGNILYAAGSLWMIDHADALGGSMRRLWNLAELTDMAVPNELAIVLEGLSDAERSAHLDIARRWIAHPASGLDIAEALACAGIDRWQTAAEQTELLDFVTARLTLTHTLLCKRLGHPQLPLQKTPEGAASECAADAPSSTSSPA